MGWRRSKGEEVKGGRRKGKGRRSGREGGRGGEGVRGGCISWRQAAVKPQLFLLLIGRMGRANFSGQFSVILYVGSHRHMCVLTHMLRGAICAQRANYGGTYGRTK